MNSRLFKEDVLIHFDFNKTHIGYVIDNSSFEKDCNIKVFIPELFGYSYAEYIQVNNDKKITNINKDFTNVNINTNRIINIDSLKVKNEIKSSQFIFAKILPDQHSLESKEKFISYNKPDVGEKVLVNFINGNPLNCVYTNSRFLYENENVSKYFKNKEDEES